MVAKMKTVARGPSIKLAKQRAAIRQTKQAATEKAKQAEKQLRKSGGYGVKTVSIWDVPPGGIEKSPAYRLVLSRCGGGSKMPPAKDRAGAPLKGGFPLNKYAPNVLVDGQRAYWLPDEWAQVIKNTGPGGTYVGWMSPEGKFFYHRHGYPGAIQETLGRRLTAKDGFNGILRTVRNMVSPNADKEFLRECLTASERKHVRPASDFHFAVVSARRATSEQGIADVLLVEGHFKNVGVEPTWYVDAESLAAYKSLGLKAKVGGKLTPARNLALADATRAGKRCVQVSDDIGKWEYLDIAKQDLRGETTFHKANAALAGSRRHVISPVAAAQFMLAKMRASPLKPQLGGVYPVSNPALTMGTEEFATEHFILGDFFVVDSSPCRFDNNMTLKEDYDFTCSHIKKHGSVLRCNRMFVYAKHSTNPGGAVAVRDGSGSKERYNIAILQNKWPGVFMLNKKRKDEVLMHWSHYGQEEDAEKGAQKSKVAVKKLHLKKSWLKSFPPAAVLRYTGKEAKEPYITARSKLHDKRKVEQCLGTTYTDASGKKRNYGVADLRYDISRGLLQVLKKK
mmetsp:Transcript_13561/g.22318  ORF Transcript_13561/g.22318 Transcript_13561/m.22318 type:complete len:566 (+) Transcript_13561:88-1785(+)